MAGDTLKSRSEIKRMVAVDPWTVIHEVEKLKSQLADLRNAAAKVNTWIKAHPRKATIAQSVKDELDAALATALPPEELSK